MKEDQESNDALDVIVKDAMSKELPTEVNERLRDRLSAFRTLLDARELSMRPRSRTVWTVLRATAALAVAAALIVGAGLVFDSRTAPSWAEVLETFDSTPYFNATIYVKADALAEPVQLELWMTRGGKLRLRAGNQVIFGDKGRTIETVAFAPGVKPAEGVKHARDMVGAIVEAVGRAEDFSFDTLVQALPQAGTMSAPLANQNASISRDLVVFDIANNDSPEWVRIWALRESRLPVRVLFWDPRNAASVDVALSYANQQPPEFFDPTAFKENLSKSTWRPADRAYGLLSDAGGQPVTPRDVTEWQTRQNRETAPRSPDSSAS